MSIATNQTNENTHPNQEIWIHYLNHPDVRWR